MMKNGKTLRTGFWLILLSLVGKIFGLIKQIVIAWAFGANDVSDVYFVADGAVAMIAVVISGAFSITLLSYYSKILNASLKERRSFVGNIMIWGIIISAIIICFICIFSPWLAKILAPNFSLSKQTLLSKYIVFLSFSVALIISSSLGGAILEGECDFLPSKLQNIFISLTTIALVVGLYKKIGIYSLLVGYLVGYFIHYLFVSFRLKNKNLYCLALPRLNSEIKALAKMSVLIIIGNSAVEINHLIDKMLASGLEDGSVSALYYGQIISTDIVTTILVYSISAIFLREFSKLAKDGNVEEIIRKVKTVCGYYVPLGILLLIIYGFYSDDIIRILLLHGNYDHAAANITRTVCLGYMLCFIVVPIKDILMKTHYSMLDSKRPMIICVFESLTNVIISFFLSKSIGILGIALGTSISALISCVIFGASVKKYFSKFHLFTLKQLMIVFLSGLTVCGVKKLVDYTVFSKSLSGRICTAVVLCILYIALLIMFKYPYLCEIINKYRGKEQSTTK